MSNTAATLSLNIPAITALCTGPRGSQIFAASGLPTNTNNTYGGNPGLSGDYYIDASTGLYYGPKTTVWPTTPLFSLINAVSSFAYTLVSGTTSLIIPQYGNNKIFSTSNNSAILGGQNNALTGNNSFILGSNITAAITGFTLVNNLSTTGTVYTNSGDSNLWYSAYTAVVSNSANWSSTYSSFSGVSAQSSAVFTAVSPNSANWNSTYTTVTANSGNWQSAYGVTSSLAYLTYALNSSLSSIIPNRGTFTVSGTASNIGGGNFNNILGSYSSVLGGAYNTASGGYSNITGGYSGRAIGNYSNIAGGICNTASGYSSSIGGGFGNTASGINAAIVAGCGNTASNCSAFIGGGKFNVASGIRAGVVTGLCNTASGNYSFIAGGSANDTKGFSNTFIFGTGLSATQANYTYTNNAAVGGALNVTGITTLSSNLTVAGTISAATAVYANGLLLGSGSANSLPLSGGTLTGGLSAPSLSANSFYSSGNQTVMTDGSNTTGNGAGTFSINYQNGAYIGLSGSGALYALSVPKYGSYLTVNGTAFGPTSTAFFAASPTDTLISNGVYEYEARLVFQKTTAAAASASLIPSVSAGTSVAADVMLINLPTYSATTILTPTVSANSIVNSGINPYVLGVTQPLANGGYYTMKIKGIIIAPASGTTIQLNMGCGSGTITPLTGSYRKLTRIA